MNATPRTFRAPSTQEAFDLIQKELGPEALIVSVRQVPAATPWQAWKRPEVEVVAIANQADESEKSPVSLGQVPRARGESQIPVDKDTSKKKEIEALLLELLARSDGRKQKREPPPSLLAFKDHLLRQGVEATLVDRLIATCLETLSPQSLQNQDYLRRYLQGQLEAYIRTFTLDLLNSPAPSTPWVLVLVGPSGAGKTSTCAKLAALASSMLQRKVVWINADTVRSGAIALARAYTEPLGVSLHLAYTPEELAEAVKAAAAADLILVDTPACNPQNPSQVVELGAFLTAIPERVTLMTIPATTRESDALEAISCLSPFHLRGLVITKLDETKAFGSAVNLAWRGQLPLAYFTSGNRLLGDLQAAHAARLSALLFGERLRDE